MMKNTVQVVYEGPMAGGTIQDPVTLKETAFKRGVPVEVPVETANGREVEVEEPQIEEKDGKRTQKLVKVKRRVSGLLDNPGWKPAQPAQKSPTPNP